MSVYIPLTFAAASRSISKFKASSSGSCLGGTSSQTGFTCNARYNEDGCNSFAAAACMATRLSLVCINKAKAARSSLSGVTGLEGLQETALFRHPCVKAFPTEPALPVCLEHCDHCHLLGVLLALGTYSSDEFLGLCWQVLQSDATTVGLML